jgi:hypothetical protein
MNGHYKAFVRVMERMALYGNPYAVKMLAAMVMEMRR